MSTETWLALNRQLVSLILDAAALAKVASCAGKYSTVVAELNVLVSVGTIGTHIFGHAIAAVIADVVAAAIQKHIDSMLKLQRLDAAILSKAKADADTDIRAIDNIHLLPHKRDVTGSYRGIVVQTTVKNIQDELNWRMSLAWQGLAVQTGVLNKLWCEDRPLGRVGGGSSGYYVRCSWLGLHVVGMGAQEELAHNSGPERPHGCMTVFFCFFGGERTHLRRDWRIDVHSHGWHTGAPYAIGRPRQTNAHARIGEGGKT